MTSNFKKDPDGFDQGALFATNVFVLLPKNHECYIYEEIFKQIDTSSVEIKYKNTGQHAYHPRLVVGILIYAYSHGVFSSRQIERNCHENLAFMHVSHTNCPNFRVLSDFRKDNYEFFKECFKQTVSMAIELGMISLGHVSLDGSKFKADTSIHKAMSYGRLKKKESELVYEIETLCRKANKCDNEEDCEYQDKTGYEIPKELEIKEKRVTKIKEAKKALEKREKELNPNQKIEAKKQISFADKEACIMGKKGRFEYAYNGQTSVDSKKQIIIGQHLTLNANDKKEVEPALKEIKNNIGKLPDKMTMDNGYISEANLEILENTDIDAYVATGKHKKKDSKQLDESTCNLVKADFIYDSENDNFKCPNGKILNVKSESSNGSKIYQASIQDCEDCVYKSRCSNSKKGKPRKIKRDNEKPLKQKMIKKMEKEKSKQIYKRRKTIVEPVFGQMKKNLGFRGFSLRGFSKVSGEFSLICACHNLKKIVKAVFTGEVRPDFSKFVNLPSFQS